MRMPAAYRLIRGQTTIEYLLLLAVVAIVVIASFGPGSLVDQVRNSAEGYYNSVTRVIMGENPQKINGGWCPVTAPSGAGPAMVYRACECPAPAFGGLPCTDPGNPNYNSCGTGQTCNGAQVTFNNVTACGPCPAGQACNSQGVCVGCTLDCSSLPNSSPDSTCTQCACNQGSHYVAGPPASCTYCTSVNGQCTTSSDGKTCTVISPPTNMNCNAVTNTLQCNSGAYYVGPGCAYCTAAPDGNCQTSSDGKTCSEITCPQNMNCNTGTNACQCNSGAYYVGPGCSYCASANGQCTASSDGKTCSAVTCPTNMNCNTALNQCQCNAGTYSVGTGCSYCQPCYTSNDGKTCVPVVCGANMWCNPAAPSDQECQCDAGAHYVGPGCAY